MNVLAKDENGTWTPRPIPPGRPVPLDTVVAGGGADLDPPGNRGAVMIQAHTDGRRALLLAASGSGVEVAVNGESVILGVKLLGHRDAIVLRRNGSEPVRLYLSTESTEPVAPQPAPESLASTRCLLCSGTLTPGSPVVRCPGCGRYYHASKELDCYTYAPKCRCGHPTRPAGPSWSPEDL